MTSIMERVAAVPPQDGRVDPAALSARIEALQRFADAAEPYLTSPEERLRPARALVERAGQRLALSGEHTVVALAGPTGCGKSSLFNALAGMNLSPVGVRRPTTGQAYACVWGQPAAAGPVLDWLRVPAPHRFARNLEGDQFALRGLVLVDLPDFDSIELDHSAEVDRMLELVDLVVWVVDPQKYADRTLHERALKRFRRHGDVTLVALNQADLLRADELTLLLKDLRRLLNSEGLGDVPAIATSAVDLPTGLGELRANLADAVSRRQAAVRRLAGDLDLVVEDLADLVGPEAGEDTAGEAVVRELADGLVAVIGVPALSEAVASSYRRRAVAAMEWPPLAWLRRLRVEQLPALAGSSGGGLTTTASRTDASVAQRVTAGLAARAVATQVSRGLPFPWPDAIAAASRSRLYELPDALTAAITQTAPEVRVDRAPTWWRLVGVGQWVLAAAALVGLGWLAIGWILALVALPMTQPSVGPVPVPALLLIGGLLLGAATAAMVRPAARWAAENAGARAEHRLRTVISDVGQEYVVTPVRAVLRAYAQAREALYAAAGLR